VKRSSLVTAALWICQILIAVVILPAGYAKLTGAPAMVQLFQAIGLGQWFRYVTGTIEVVSAVLLFVPATSFIAAILLACTMIGAAIVHLVVLHVSPGFPLGLLALLAVVIWLRLPQRVPQSS
jgi:putative oxidoreductase